MKISRFLSLAVVLGTLAGLAPVERICRAQDMPLEPAPQVEPPSSRPSTSGPSNMTRPNRRQRNIMPDAEMSKRAATILKTLTPLAERVRRSVGVVVIDGKDSGFATVVRADGYLVTKASELVKDKFSVRMEGARTTLLATLVGVAKAHDLALIKVEAANLAPVEWADPATIRVGQMVVTVGNDRQPTGVGVVSVGRRPTTGGFLGVSLLQTEEGIRVMGVEPGRPAQKAGILAGDFIVAINNQQFEEREDLSAFLQLQSAGTEVSVTVRRGEEELVFRATLAQRPLEQSDRARTQNNMGSELSNRRTDFPTILQHDTVLQRWQQGGPLVDLDGKVVGINIARAGRVETYALPVEVVQALVPELIAGVYPATTQPSAAVEISTAMEEISQARTELKSILEGVEKGIDGLQKSLDAMPENDAREKAERELERLSDLRDELREYEKDIPNASPGAGSGSEDAKALAEHVKRLRALAESIRATMPSTQPSSPGGK